MGLGEGNFISKFRFSFVSKFFLFDLGTTFPALSSLLAAWIPLKERSKLGSLVFGGGQVSRDRNTNYISLIIGYISCLAFHNQ